MKITKHGQSCLFIETEKGSRVLIDPGKFVFGEPENLKNTDADFTDIDVLVITHEHPDHFDENTIEIIKREKPVVFANAKVSGIIAEETMQDCKLLLESLSIGPFGKGKDIYITGVESRHGDLPNGKPVPEVAGVIVDDGENQLYHPGDTVEIKSIGADIIAVPIAGTVTTTAEEARDQIARFKIKPKLVIPIHFENPAFLQEQDRFEAVMKEAGLKGKYLKNGESVTVN